MAGKIVYDFVHGYISLSNEVLQIIDTPSFQRLKNIQQTTAQHLFPSANHTRYEHSLGVMKIAQNVFEHIYENIYDKYFSQYKEKMSKKDSDIDDLALRIKARRQTRTKLKDAFVHLTIASLLHDVGHAPLSHLGEHFFDKDEIISAITQVAGDPEKDFLRDSDFEVPEEKFNTFFDCDAKAHELMSCYVILTKYSVLLKLLYKKINLELIFRAIIGKKYSRNPNTWVENIIIEILNSDSFDVDKLDYILRDNQMTGNPAPAVDYQRLINNLCLDRSQKLAFTSKGISTIQTLIDSRDTFYMLVINHHIVAYTDFILEALLHHLMDKDNLTKEMRHLTLSREMFFSPVAIADKMVDDHDLMAQVNNLYRLPLEEKTDYANKLFEQIYSRRFLKCVWKTLYDYKDFCNCNHFDAEQQEHIGKIKTDVNCRRKIIKEIISRLQDKYPQDNIGLGDVFLIPRANKFYSLSGVEFHVIFQKSQKKEKVSEIAPLRKHSDHFDDIAFYLFGKKELIPDVEQTFKDILNEDRFEEKYVCV